MLAGFNAPWPLTVREWIKQGAPEQIKDTSFFDNYFQFDPLIRGLREIKTGAYLAGQIDLGNGATYFQSVRTAIVPSFEPRIISEEGSNIILTNAEGQKIKVPKDSAWETMPLYLDHPVKDRASWNELRKRLDPDTPERWPSDWDTYVEKINNLDKAVMLNVGSFFGALREWVGLKELLYMFYDDPNLVEDMMNQICYLETECLKRILKDIRIDCAWFWEDMAFKTGPLISPDMVRKFMLPRYHRITDILHSSGVDIILVDSDGDVNKLIPLWLEVGINGYYPLEVAAGNDAVALRKKYGKEIIMLGAIDKRVLTQGREKIREEVMSKVPFLLEQGGYLPAVDHAVPHNVPWENYRYFVNTMREVAGLDKLPE
jgi:uroporphyrinogen decarboxylase